MDEPAHVKVSLSPTTGVVVGVCVSPVHMRVGVTVTVGVLGVGVASGLSHPQVEL